MSFLIVLSLFLFLFGGGYHGYRSADYGSRSSGGRFILIVTSLLTPFVFRGGLYYGQY